MGNIPSHNPAWLIIIRFGVRPRSTTLRTFPFLFHGSENTQDPIDFLWAKAGPERWARRLGSEAGLGGWTRRLGTQFANYSPHTLMDIKLEFHPFAFTFVLPHFSPSFFFILKIVVHEAPAVWIKYTTEDRQTVTAHVGITFTLLFIIILLECGALKDHNIFTIQRII
jgi:hypothetical protein